MSFWLRWLCALVVLICLAPASSIGATEAPDLHLHVVTPRYQLSTAGLSVSGYATNVIPGAPALPVYGAVVEIPGNTAWTLAVMETESVPLSQPVAIPPVPAPWSGASRVYGLSSTSPHEPALSAFATPDPAIYRTNAYYPSSVVSAGTEQWERGKRLLPVRVFPFQYNPVTRVLLYHPDVHVTIHLRPLGTSDTTALSGQKRVAPLTANRSPDASTEWGALRLRIAARGLHRLTYNDLQTAGVDLSVADPTTFQITHLGQPVRIQVTGSEDHSFDPGDLVIFYGEPYVGRWMASEVYRFSYGSMAAPGETRMTERIVSPSGEEPVITTTSQTLHIEKDAAYYYDFWISTEADHFFDNPLYPSTASGTKVVTRTYDMALDDPTPDGQMLVSGLLYGGADQGPNPDEWAKLQVNSHDLATYTWNGRTPYTITAVTAPMSWLDQSSNKLNLIADLNNLPSLGEYWYYPDWIDVTYPAYADAEGDRIEIRPSNISQTSARIEVTGFSTDAVGVFDVRDPRNPVHILTTRADPVNGATRISFWDVWDPVDPSPAYSLSTEEALLAPVAIEADVPSSWKSPDHNADYIAIVHHSFWNAIDPLLDLRAAQGLHVVKVDVQDIYDEFNYGRLHQDAIRSFIKYAYDNWNGAGARPRYVLFVGDATYDYKHVFQSTLNLFVPAFLGNFDPWYVETPSDARYADLDGPSDQLPELLVGRIPAQTPEDVTAYVNKVLSYEDKSITPDGPWQNQVAYVADDDANSAGNFHSMSDDIRLNWLPSYYTSTTVYFNPTEPPVGGYTTAGAMKSGIRQAFNSDQVFLQWFGHASKFRWGSAGGIWNIFDPPTLAANTHLPFVAAFSCFDGYFIEIVNNYQALSEVHLLQPGRGSIAGLSPSGEHVGSALTVLNQGLTRSFFQDRIAIAGEAVNAARRFYFANATGWMDVLDTSIFFGDPALRLRLPLPFAVAPVIWAEAGPGQSVTLGWNHLEPDTAYKVWRGSSPYFNAGAEGVQVGTVNALAAGYTVGSVVSFSDDGTAPPPFVTLLGDPENNYFWLVGGTNWRGASPDSNRVGEFDFALTPGGKP